MMDIEIGIYDSPQTQEKPRLSINLLKSNIAVFGGPMSGKTTFVKTMLVRLHEIEQQTVEQQIYIIDFGGNIGKYAELKNVCACFDNYNEEDTKGVFKTVEHQLAENIKKLNNRSYLDVYKKDPSMCPPHILLIIENINAFLADERYASYQDTLMKFCRDGLSKGLTLLFTAYDLNGALNRMISNFGNRFAFEMPADKYFEIFNTKVFPPMRYPGRGLASVNNVPHEFQCFLPFKNEDSSLESLIERSNARTQFPIKKMCSLPRELTKENIGEYAVGNAASDSAYLALGLDYYSHEPVKLQFERQNVVAIYGKREFGKTNLLRLMMQGLLAHHKDYRYVFVDDGRKQLEKIYQETKTIVKQPDLAVYFTDYDELIEYLEKNGYEKMQKDTLQERKHVAAAPASAAAQPQEKRSLMSMFDMEEPKKEAPARTPLQTVSAAAAPDMGVAAPFTVFILQNKGLTQTINKRFTQGLLPRMINVAEEKGYFFIYSDMRGKITDPDLQSVINNNLITAFVLDNLGEFVADKGSKTVFGEMDAMELKAQYAKCMLGDGYYYDIDSDNLHKLKFFKCDETLSEAIARTAEKE